MRWCFRVTIFVVSVSMQIGSSHAICAAGEFNDTNCVEPYLILSGQFRNYNCDRYARQWAPFCAEEGYCDGCVCSCGPGTGCQVRPSEVCTSCPHGHRGDGLTCTLCEAGTVSTLPPSDSCLVSASIPCPITRSLTCSDPCACTPTTSANSGVITDGPGTYQNNMVCQYMLISNFIVKLYLTFVDIERSLDHITIDRCTSPTCKYNYRLLRVFTNSTNAQPSTIHSTTTSHPFMQLVFTSDDSNVQEGWSANWFIDAIPPECTSSVPSCIQGQYLNSNSC